MATVRQFPLRLSSELLAAVQAAARIDGQPVAVWVREAIAQRLARDARRSEQLEQVIRRLARYPVK